MSYQPVDLNSAKVLADSVWYPRITGPDELTRRDLTQHAFRITSFELTFARSVLAEFNTHCQIARNSGSSRAIPVEKMIKRVLETPFVPLQFSKNQKGMSASEYWVPGDPEYDDCVAEWLNARDWAVASARALLGMGVHKQDVNRLLEPFMWHTVVATATWEHWDWPNFIRLRASEHADPKIQGVAYALKAAAEASVPTELNIGDWHLPLIGFPGDEDLTLAEKIKVSTGRVARTSYLTHNGVRDPEADLRLYDDLQAKAHLSPFEQVAKAEPGRHAKFTGWRSARTWVENGLEVEV